MIESNRLFFFRQCLMSLAVSLVSVWFGSFLFYKSCECVNQLFMLFYRWSLKQKPSLTFETALSVWNLKGKLELLLITLSSLSAGSRDPDRLHIFICIFGFLSQYHSLSIHGCQLSDKERIELASHVKQTAKQRVPVVASGKSYCVHVIDTWVTAEDCVGHLLPCQCGLYHYDNGFVSALL